MVKDWSLISFSKFVAQLDNVIKKSFCWNFHEKADESEEKKLYVKVTIWYTY